MSRPGTECGAATGASIGNTTGCCMSCRTVLTDIAHTDTALLIDCFRSVRKIAKSGC